MAVAVCPCPDCKPTLNPPLMTRSSKGHPRLLRDFKFQDIIATCTPFDFLCCVGHVLLCYPGCMQDQTTFLTTLHHQLSGSWQGVHGKPHLAASHYNYRLVRRLISQPHEAYRGLQNYLYYFGGGSLLCLKYNGPSNPRSTSRGLVHSPPPVGSSM